ncbi:DNRLRE domain-containing protein [Streptosporangium sp. NPDC050855]|uniref:DNRLRE domain-containing protein n=1 Tax=Streptosporangium sp. NPDC050855 TaxID=3366194 RepID=UPI0037A01BA3
MIINSGGELVRRSPSVVLVAVTAAMLASAQQLPAAASPAPAPPPAAQSTPPPGELLGAATQDRRVTRQPDGRLVIEAWTQPVRVHRDGAWRWIDPTLVESGGVLRPKVTATPVEFTSGGAGKPLATLTTQDGKPVTFTWPTALARPTVTGGKAVYADAAGPGSSLVVTALPTGFRWEIVLKSRPSKKIAFTLPVQAQGLAVRPGKNGAATIVNGAGREVARSTAVAMRSTSAPSRRRVSAKKTAQDRPVEPDTAFRTSPKMTAQALTVEPDAAFLADSQTVYPVTIGATVGTAASSDVDISNEGNQADPDSAVLTTGSIFGTLNRSYLKFDGTALAGQDVADATLTLTNTDGPGCGETASGIQVRRVTSGWDAATLTWDTAPSSTTEGAQTITQSYGPDCGIGPLEWPITDIARAWAEGYPNYGLVLQAPDDSGSDDDYRMLASSEYGWPELTPKITVTAQPAPGPTVVSPAGPDGVEVFTAPAAWKLDTLPIPTTSAHALNSAYDRAQGNAAILAPPYFDPASGRVIAPATPAGQGTAGQVLTGTAIDNGDADETIPGYFDDEDSAVVPAVPPAQTGYSSNPRVVEVANSYQALNTIVDEVLDLDDAIPAGTELFATHIWPERNLVVVQSTDASAQLRKALADRYGTYNVAIWLRSETDRFHLLDQTRTTATTAADNRQEDVGKVNGGSSFTATTERPGWGKWCTTGFSMGSASDKLMVTAGHCLLPQGGSASVGSILWSNWHKGTGTVKLPGQPTYYGDLGLLHVDVRGTSPTIFVGDKNSSTKRWVGGRYSVRAKEGDQYCTGGASTGQICRWKVTDLAWKIDMGGQTVRWVHVGKKRGRCVIDGDSGGPVYTFRPDGYVVAKGITSGSSSPEEPIQDTCMHTFTDFHDVMKAVGKDIYKK